MNGDILDMDYIEDISPLELSDMLKGADKTGDRVEYWEGWNRWKTNEIPLSWNTYAYEFTLDASDMVNITTHPDPSEGSAVWEFYFGGDGKYTDQQCFPADTWLYFDNLCLVDMTTGEVLVSDIGNNYVEATEVFKCEPEGDRETAEAIQVIFRSNYFCERFQYQFYSMENDRRIGEAYTGEFPVEEDELYSVIIPIDKLDGFENADAFTFLNYEGCTDMIKFLSAKYIPSIEDAEVPVDPVNDPTVLEDCFTVYEGEIADLEYKCMDGVHDIWIKNGGGASNGGEDRWDAQFRKSDLALEYGHTYRIAYSVNASQTGQMYAKIGDITNDDCEYWHNNGNLLEMDYLADADADTLVSALRNANSTGESFKYYEGWDKWKQDAYAPDEWDTRAYEFTISKSDMQNITSYPDVSEGTAELTFHFGGDGTYTQNPCFPNGTTLLFDNLCLIDMTTGETLVADTGTMPADFTQVYKGTLDGDPTTAENINITMKANYTGDFHYYFKAWTDVRNCETVEGTVQVTEGRVFNIEIPASEIGNIKNVEYFTLVSCRNVKDPITMIMAEYIEAETEPPTEAPVPGDADGDGEVTIVDAITLQQSLLGILEALIEALDLDGSGAIDAFDLAILKTMLLQ